MSQNEECYWKFSDEKYIFIENQFRDNILVKSDTTVYKKNNGLLESKEHIVYISPEIFPSFKGGAKLLNKFIKKRIAIIADTKNNTDNEIEYNNICSTIYLTFIVNKDGSISKVGVNYSCDSRLDKFGLQIVRTMPNWTPGYIGKEPVNSIFTIPITFGLF